MPKSKRNTSVTLSKTQKKPSTSKQELVESVQESLDYKHVYLIQVLNMRNIYFKQFRADIQGKVFFGKLRVLKKVLEGNEHLNQLVTKLQGNDKALVFTNLSVQELNSVIEKHEYQDIAKTGFTLQEEIIIPKGELMHLDGTAIPNNMNVFLRKLGLPVELDKGKLMVREDYKISGVLTPEKSNILKQLGYKLSTFKVIVLDSVVLQE